MKRDFDRSTAIVRMARAKVGRASKRAQGLCVLVVDHDEELANATAKLLRACGHHVRVALDGTAALLAAQDCPPDVVLLDIPLPGMAGYQVVRELKEQPGEKKPMLIAITNRGKQTERRRLTAAVSDLPLVKPVADDRLQGLFQK